MYEGRWHCGELGPFRAPKSPAAGRIVPSERIKITSPDKCHDVWRFKILKNVTSRDQQTRSPFFFFFVFFRKPGVFFLENVNTI